MNPAPMTWVLHLPIDLPSANRHGGAATNARHAANAAMYRRQRTTWVTMLRLEARRVGLATPRLELVPWRAVTITRLWAKGCRAWDDDNMVAACKGLRDAMQYERIVRRKGKLPRLIAGAGIVRDDSRQWSAWTYLQRKADDGQAGVELVVCDA